MPAGDAWFDPDGTGDALKQVGDDVELKLGGSDKVLFENTTLDQFTPDVFDIA